MSAMIDIMENVTSTRILFQSALQAYLDACSAFRKSAMAGEFPLAKLESFTSNELALCTSHEGKLQTAKALLGNVQNYTKPVGSLPSEILSRIFHLVPLEPLSEGTCNYFRFPKRLEYISHTCACWRQAAPDTPSLWTSLCFAPDIIVNRGLTSRATVYTARAGGLPLEINITQYDYDGDPSSRTGCWIEDNLLPEFLTLVAHRVSSIELYGEFNDSKSYIKGLETCLAGATPGILTQLSVSQKSSPVNVAIGSSQDSGQIPDVGLDVPVQRLEDLLSSVTGLSLYGYHFHWSSKVYHGLVELQLGFIAPSVLDHLGFKISESHLSLILSSSPGLQRFAFNMQIQVSSSGDDLVTPVALEDLEVLDLRGLNHSHLGLVLRLVAPGSRLSVVWLTLDDDDVQDSHVNGALKYFFGRFNTPNLGLAYLSSLQWLKTLSGLVNNLSILVLQDVTFSDILPVTPQWKKVTPMGLDFADRLHLSNCTLRLAPVKWILNKFHPRILTLWKCRDSTDYWASLVDGRREEVIPTLSQECPNVKILQNDRPDSAWDRP